MNEGQKAEEVSLKPLIIRGVVITALIFATVWIVGHYLAEPAEHLAELIVQNLGIWGIFGAVIAADGLTLPIPPDAYLLAAVASDSDATTIVSVVSVASVIAGTVAYVVGPFLGRFRFLGKRLEKVRPQGEVLFAKYGTWTIVLAALTPLPFSVTCWLAGIYRMPYRPFFLATLARIPRFWLYYLMFEFGWTM